jgi:hypothetical protein
VGGAGSIFENVPGRPDWRVHSITSASVSIPVTSASGMKWLRNLEERHALVKAVA